MPVLPPIFLEFDSPGISHYFRDLVPISLDEVPRNPVTHTDTGAEKQKKVKSHRSLYCSIKFASMKSSREPSCHSGNEPCALLGRPPRCNVHAHQYTYPIIPGFFCCLLFPKLFRNNPPRPSMSFFHPLSLYSH